MTSYSRNSRRISLAAWAAGAMLACFPLAIAGWGQVAGGTIQGTITDSSGAVVPGAKVSIADQATGVMRGTTSNESGLYAAPNLTPGHYRISVSAPGFAQAEVSDQTLAVGAQLEVNFRLQLGNVSQTVQVNAAAPAIELASSTLSQQVNSRTVVELPLNGRDWTSLATLQPGVANVFTQPAVNISNQRANRGNGVQLTISGNRPQQNNYRVDGISINDYSNGTPGSVLGGTLGVDAVEEFSVITSNAPAEYGRSSGGIINAVTRSGSNAFHGDAYEFLRNSAFDARSPFDATPGPPPFKRNQFGASAGGPIWKDHTFVFGDYEGLRQGLGFTQVSTVPSAALHNGPVDPAIKPFLALYPLPNTGSSGAQVGTFSLVSQQVTNENFFTSRVDHHISNADTLAGTYLIDRADSQEPDNFNLKLIGSLTRRQLATLEETHIFSPSFVNAIRFGYSRYVSDAPRTLNAINPAAADPSLGFVPGLPVGLINISGIANFQGGLGAVGEYIFHYNSYQVYDDAFLTRGIHSLKFGFSVERMQDNQLGTANPNGQFIFGGLAQFLANQPTSFNAPISTALTPRDLRQTVFGAYAQDDLQWRPNLTLNLGLRYEMTTVPGEVHNELAALANLTDPGPRTGTPYFSNPTLRNFDPRLGFSWDPFRTGKTAVRGAFGMYDVLPLPYQFELISLLSAPFFEAGNIATLAAGSFPKGAYPLLTPNKLRQGYVQPNPKRNYVMQWNLNVQRQVAKDVTVAAGYVGSHGVHQPFHADDVNYVLPVPTSQGYQWPIPYRSGTLMNPNVGQISAVFYNGSSSYNGLNLQVTKALSHGLQLQASYTWSKSIDLGSSSIAGDTFGNSVSSLPFFDPRLRRGLSDFDVRHNLVLNYIWQIPGPQSLESFPRWLLDGWQYGGIYEVSSGLPFTPIIGGDPLGLKSADTFAFPNRSYGPGCSTAVNPQNAAQYLKVSCFSLPANQELLGNSGRNSVIGPGLENFDMSLFKNNPIRRISENFNIQFRFEVFNIFNRPNFEPPGNPQRQIFNASLLANPAAGRLTTLSTPSRQMQFGLKFIW
ncbi:MAG TPA: TonB-dependent receptor [Candidatus Acidoferrales bacterium]|nr:TonB-dependent receptor [Candidatus Acidoferrales bacterium]